MDHATAYSTPVHYSYSPAPQPSRPSLQPAPNIASQPSSLRRSGRSRPSHHDTPSTATATSARYAPYPQPSSAHASRVSTPQTQPPPLPSNPPGPPSRVIRPPSQALTTTFPSRLRTGTTLLVQPLHTAPPPPAGLANPHASEARSKRRAAVNYAELDSPSEEEDEAEEGDDPGSDYVGDGIGGVRLQSTQKQPKGGRLMDNRTELERSYLGEPPPARWVQKRTVPVKIQELPNISQDSIDKSAQVRECLIPIRVEFDTETHRVRDSFLWNLYERHLQPEEFAKQFLTEIEVSLAFSDQVVAMIKSQIEEFESVATFGETATDPVVAAAGDDGEEEHPDCRVQLNLDVQISTYHLMDTLEYSLSPSSIQSTLCPTLLSRTLTSDLSLPPSASPLIAHALTEELLKRKKDAIEAGLLGGPSGGGERHRGRVEKGVGIWRDVGQAGWVGGGAPRLEVLSGEELERREGERDRAIRRLRRETARHQVSLRRRR